LGNINIVFETFVFNLSTFDPALEKAVLYAVGNTLVCDVLEEAKSLAWGQERYKGDIYL
jgi:structural maintenance of chromosome 1